MMADVTEISKERARASLLVGALADRGKFGRTEDDNSVCGGN